MRTCVPQGKSPPLCIVALAPFASRNVPMPAFMRYPGGLRDVFTPCSRKFRIDCAPTCVAQGISPPFRVAALAPSPFRIVLLRCLTVFSHHFGAKSKNIHVYSISLSFVLVSKALRPEFAQKIVAQMRSPRNFPSIVHNCPCGICNPKCINAGVYAISPEIS